jgi:hypothetical protein
MHAVLPPTTGAVKEGARQVSTFSFDFWEEIKIGDKMEICQISLIIEI